MHIRPIQDADLPAVAHLLNVLAREFIVHESTPMGAAGFLRENDEEGLRRLLGIGYVYHVAVIDGAVAGFVGVREHKHLYHLFVAREHHGKGIARRLWNVARQVAADGGNDGGFTVNSSNYAVGLYQALGFVRTAPTQCKNGLYYNPMATGSSVPAFIRAP
jgi:ribosomal protein S18 acetylase RimI-like enzyme